MSFREFISAILPGRSAPRPPPSRPPALLPSRIAGVRVVARHAGLACLLTKMGPEGTAKTKTASRRREPGETLPKTGQAPAGFCRRHCVCLPCTLFTRSSMSSALPSTLGAVLPLASACQRMAADQNQKTRQLGRTGKLLLKSEINPKNIFLF